MDRKFSTKEKIINAAIDLFSQKGLYETTVREIAAATGIKVRSLYAHFTGKDTILDIILERYREEINKVRMPDQMLDRIVASATPEAIFTRGLYRIRESVASVNMDKIIRILLIEMYRSLKVREFYLVWYFDENRNTLKKLFAKMQEKGLIKDHDPETLSPLYNAFVNSYYHEY